MTDRIDVLAVLGVLTLLLCLPDLVTQSLAFDGLIYGNVASLLAQGQGSFWHLPYFDSQIQKFQDHPPLAIWLLAVVKSVFGSVFWVEKALGLVAAALTIIAIRLITRQLSTAPPLWWIWLLLIAMPLTTDVWMGGYLENLLTPVMLTAMALCLAARANLLFALGFGLLTFIGLLIKGPVGLFPFLVPLGLWWLDGKFWPAFTIGFCGLVTVVVALGITIWLWPEAGTYLKNYLQQQVLASISGERPAQYGRMDLLLFFVGAMIIPLIVIALVARDKPRVDSSTKFLWLMLLAFLLPLLLSARHYDHYLMPALALGALALAYSFPVAKIPTAIAHRIPLVGIALALMVIVWSGIAFNNQGRHQDDISDAAAIAGAKSSVVGYCDANEALKARAYLFRNHGIRTQRWIAGDEASEVDWLLCLKQPNPAAKLAAELHDGNKLWLLNK